MRKTILSVVGALLVLGLRSAASAEQFEGLVVIRYVGNGQSTEMRWYFKPDKVRMEGVGPGTSGRPGAIIFDMKKRVMYDIQLDQKSYREMPVPPGLNESAGNQQSRGGDTLLRQTSRKEHVAGLPCDVYEVKDGNRVAFEVCIASGIAPASTAEFMVVISGEPSGERSLQRELYGGGRFPIKTSMRNSAGVAQIQSEAVAIERRKLDDALFVPPPAYTKRVR
ncbi:MAG: DUF4412 domain-containing protein [Nitrospiraceae bacterium]